MKDHYNVRPDFWREVTEEEFARAFFHYVFKPPVSRQMLYDTKFERLKEPIFNVRLFEIEYGGKWDGLGVAMVGIVKDARMKEIKYFMFGDPKVWKKNEQEFIAQFANDNS